MKNLVINISIKIIEALNKLEKNSQKCLLVTDNKKKFLGTLNDGDIRRAILKGADINSSIGKYIRKKPLYIREKDVEEGKKIKSKYINNLSKKINESIDLIPVINNRSHIIKILLRKDFKNLFNSKKILEKIPLLIMAGGRGARLKEFTNYFPKPLVPFNNSTATEYIIDNFKKYGVKKFIMSLHYKKNLIKSYLRENNVKNLTFLEEKKPMGTAGSIGLLKEKVKSDLFVINCDTLLSINLEKFFEFHKKNNFSITMVAAHKNFQLLYGSCVINKNGELNKISEKPNLNYLVNVGLYLIKPSLINYISKKKSYNMDALIKDVKRKGGKIGVFPISENNWIDTGVLKSSNTDIL